ncbi:MFS transporter [Corynebacterium sp. p3-SID1056]|uniref:MFS transporter n=1 Tax=Corynebacterium sp. p3-SID1056 TaxID=2916092 RepID=UPI0021A8212F|nr:MFS transporter [Corynebacterium sp. p3-SID1056]MCT2338370.1 MFS transporter [Corynebacterium sp. p3-SID1056]
MTATTTKPATAEHHHEYPADRKSLGASLIGQILEWFEWSSYAVFAPFIAAAMFHKADQTSALLATFGVFAVGFLVRPLGGIIFGHIADRKGRKSVLMTTIIMMAVASVAIGLLPSYDTVGIWASIGLLIIRVVQGFAHGGESAAANSYIPEIAPPSKRGKWGSLVYVSIFGGSVIAYVIGGCISLVLSDDQIAAWGWRIPFWLSALAAVFALYMRRHMKESDHFTELDEAVANEDDDRRAHEAVDQSVNKRSVVANILLVIGMVSGVTASHYTWTSYVSTYAISQQGMSTQGAYWVTVVAQIIGLIALPLWGSLSDKIGRKPVMYIFAVLLAIVQLPLMGLIDDRPWTLLVASTLAIIVVAAGGALLSPIMSEVFPTDQRTRAIGLAYSISVAVFGGTAPYIFQWFVAHDMSWASGTYVVAMAILTLISMYILPETKGIDLRHA